MRFSRISVRVLRSLGPVIGAIGCAVALVALAPMPHDHIYADYCPASAPCTPPPPSPVPTPTPTNAFLSLDVTAADPTTQTTSTAAPFLPTQSSTRPRPPPRPRRDLRPAGAQGAPSPPGLAAGFAPRQPPPPRGPPPPRHPYARGGDAQRPRPDDETAVRDPAHHRRRRAGDRVDLLDLEHGDAA